MKEALVLFSSVGFGPFLRFSVWLPAAVGLFCLPTAAAAGYWQVTFSGGATVTPGGSNPYTVNTTNGYGGGGSYVGGGAYSTSSGQITTTFTWRCDNLAEDPPPPSVVVLEQCSVAASGYYLYGMGGFNLVAEDGLGHSTPQNGNYISCSGTRYSVRNPGVGFSVTASPKASVTAIGGGFAQTSSWVSYGIGLLTPEVGLSGTTFDPVDESDNILIGQGCRAEVIPIPNITLQNFQWTITGDTFKYYVAHGYFTGRAADVTYLSAADLQVQFPHWYWRSERDPNDKVEAAIATADAYYGNTFLGRITTYRNVNVCPPQYNFIPEPGQVWLMVYPPPAGPVVLKAGNGVTPGIKWRAYAVPSPIFQAGAGIWSYNQMMYPGRWYTTDAAPANHWLNINGLLGLDTSYPYAPDNGQQIADDSNLGWADDASEHSSSDSPSQPVNDAINSANINEQFWTYMMYRPADIGLGCQWVPLHRCAWTWTANGNRPGQSWTNAILPQIAGSVTVTENVRCKTHPEWHQVHNFSNHQEVFFQP